MKIGIVTPKYPPNVDGGGERSAQLLVKNLRKRGHNVEVLSFDKEAPEDPEYVKRIDAFSDRADLLNIQCFKQIKSFSEDKEVIHSYNTALHPSVGRLSDVKTVATLNNYYHYQPYEVPKPKDSGIIRKIYDSTYLRLYSTVARTQIRKIGRFLALSTDVKDVYSRFLPGEKIEVIPNMYDPEFPEHNDLETDERELLYIGMLHPHKGVKDLIEQMPKLESYKLTIVGDGPQKEELEKLASNLGVEQRVSFEGYVDNDQIPRYYERAGWFIHPGRWPEPFGRTILEAMQMETPVIATNKGGPKDVLEKSQLIEKLDELPEKIKELERDEVKRFQEKRLEDYSPEKVTKKVEKAYKNT